ncbi:unnamed protein product [Brassica oleracea var. botrytis]|uniref:Uncharacterized protein n=1 Tax=Brassica campestris TaxID=3711 RepID=A0A3P6AM31_BRACM|nr:unnamed protein product [Brassica rapa]
MSFLIARLMASATTPPMTLSVAKAHLLAGICLHVLLSTAFWIHIQVWWLQSC